ncbi:hypothetical protein [Pseudomonas sp. LS1212]
MTRTSDELRSCRWVEQQRQLSLQMPDSAITSGPLPGESTDCLG